MVPLSRTYAELQSNSNMPRALSINEDTDSKRSERHRGPPSPTRPRDVHGVGIPEAKNIGSRTKDVFNLAIDQLNEMSRAEYKEIETEEAGIQKLVELLDKGIMYADAVSYTHLRAHETEADL
eukprot:487751-Rhodomonas_salina.2